MCIQCVRKFCVCVCKYGCWRRERRFVLLGHATNFVLHESFRVIKIYPKRIKRKDYYQIHSSHNKGTFYNNHFFDRKNILQGQSAISRKKLNTVRNKDMFIQYIIGFSRKILSILVNFFAIESVNELGTIFDVAICLWQIAD